MSRLRAWTVAPALLAALLSLPAHAQQEVQDEASVAAPAAIADWTAKPVAALTAPIAARTRLLGIGRAGTRLVAVGQQGVILTSEDGRDWRQSSSPVAQMLTRVRFTDERNGWAVGYDAVILKTTDGGQTWAVQHLEAGARPLYDILLLDGNNGIAVGGYGTYLVTADGGKTWAAQETSIAALGLHINRLQRLPDGSLFLAGEKGLMAHSTDSGANWKMLKSPYAGSLFGFLPLGGNRMLAYGMRGNVFVSDDISLCPAEDPASWDQYAAQTITDPAQIAALGWRRLENPSKESLFGAAVQKNGEVLLVGINGTALQTQLAQGLLQPVRLAAAETLVDVLSYKERLIGIGKRGAQDLGEAR